MMHYGLNLPNGGVCSDPRTLAEFAHIAEQAGWDGVFIEDYVIYQSHPGFPTGDPWVQLAAMALQTESIRLGTSVTPPDRRRPWIVAREAVAVDQLSNGRLILGVGMGDVGEPGFTHFGEVTEARRRGRMLDEALDIIVGLWSGQPFSYQGEHFRVQEVTFLPRPVQQPRIPIWVGGGYPHPGALRRAARWDGACMYRVAGGHLLPDDVRALRSFIDSQPLAPARFDISVGGQERRPDWEEERAMIRALAAAGATWWSEWVAPGDYVMMRAAIERGPLRSD